MNHKVDRKVPDLLDLFGGFDVVQDQVLELVEAYVKGFESGLDGRWPSATELEALTIAKKAIERGWIESTKDLCILMVALGFGSKQVLMTLYKPELSIEACQYFDALPPFRIFPAVGFSGPLVLLLMDQACQNSVIVKSDRYKRELERLRQENPVAVCTGREL